MSQIEIAGLCYRYPDGTEALRGFDARVVTGECVGIVGPNGAGKTTLLLVLAGFLKPTGGTVLVEGQSPAGDDVKRLRKVMGFVFHNPDDQLFMPTVMEDVTFGPRCAAEEPPADTERRARDVLAQFGIETLAGRFPGHLSAGQKRLAALAGVLVMNPRIIVMDEPTAFLDPYGRRHVLEHIARLKQTRLVVSHDLELVLELCSRVIVISAGATVAEGEPRVLLADRELMARHHLEVPPSLNRKIGL